MMPLDSISLTRFQQGVLERPARSANRRSSWLTHTTTSVHRQPHRSQPLVARRKRPVVAKNDQAFGW
jgi:hypothetical protein